MQLIIALWVLGWNSFQHSLLTINVWYTVFVWNNGNTLLVSALNSKLNKIFDMFIHYLYKNHFYILF